jgi:hypothetical protein
MEFPASGTLLLSMKFSAYRTNITCPWDRLALASWKRALRNGRGLPTIEALKNTLRLSKATAALRHFLPSKFLTLQTGQTALQWQVLLPRHPLKEGIQ